MSFTAKDVMALRKKTGLPMMECKKALGATDGDMKAAEEWARENLKDKMETRTERATAEGRIAIAIAGADASIVEIRTETDFTAKNDAFVAMTDSVAKSALTQPEGDVTVSDDMTKAIDDLRVSTGENVNFARGRHLAGGSYGSYVHHDGKRACLLEVKGAADEDTMRGICQHIVFHDPAGISEDDVDPAKINAIKSEAIDEAKATGKNDEIAQKIAEGKVRRYLQDNTLMHQKYVLDESKTIKEVLPDGTAITRFVRYTLGSDD